MELAGRARESAPRTLPPVIVDLVLLAALTFPAWRLLLAPGYPGGHDAYVHLARLVELDGAVQAGVLYPRLAPDLSFGYEYPVFNYYAPLSAYLAELFKLAGLGYLDAVKPVLIVTIVGAAWAMYLLARDTLPRAAALSAGLAYGLLPYLLVDIFVRANLAEAVALPLLPLSLWAFRRLGRRVTTWRIVLGAAVLAAVVLAHTITTLMLVPLLMVAWLASIAGNRDAMTWRGLSKSIAAAAASVTLGLALAAFFWLPALLERDMVTTHRLIEGFYDYHNQFQSLAKFLQTSVAYDYTYDWDSHVLFRMGMVQLALGVTGCLAGALLGRPHRRAASFWGLVMAGATFLQMPESAGIWDAIPPSAYLQYPWRLLAIIGVASSMLAGIAVATLISRIRWRWLGAASIAALALALAGSSLWGLQTGQLPLLERDTTRWAIQRIQTLDSNGSFEYQPIWATQNPLHAEMPAQGDSAGRLRLAMLEAGTFSMLLDVVAPEATTLLVDRHYFPGWQARVDGRAMAVRPLGGAGLLAIDLPAGSYKLSVWFGDTPVRAFGNGISAAAVLLLCIVLALAILSACRVRTPRAAGGIDTRGKRRGLLLALLAMPVALAVAACFAGVGAFSDLFGLAPDGGARAALPMLTADFGKTIRLAGAKVNERGGQDLELSLYWQAMEHPTEDYTVAVRLIDAAGRVAGRRDKQPLFGLRPTSHWSEGQLVRDVQQIALAPGVPAGEYNLVLGLAVGDRGDYLPIEAQRSASWNDGDDAGTGIFVAKVRVPAREATSPVTLARASMARFGGHIALEGYQLAHAAPDGAARPLGGDAQYAATVGQADLLRVRLQWKAIRDLDDDYAVFVHLLNARQEMVAQGDSWLHAGYRPMPLWLPGEVRQEEYEIRIPPTLLPGRYDVSVGLYRKRDMQRLALSEGTGGDRFVLGSIKVESNPKLVADRLGDARRVDAFFGGKLGLLGYELRAEGDRAIVSDGRPIKPGAKMRLVTYWRAVEQLGQDYTIFAHLYDAHGRLSAQTDGPPVDGNYPTTLWRADEVVVDSRLLDLPPGLEVGHYRLAVGLYQLQTLNRLRLDTGADLAVITGIDVGNSGGNSGY